MKFRLIETLLNEGKNVERTWEQYKDKILKTSRVGVEDERQAKSAFYYCLMLDPTYKEGSSTTGDYGTWFLNLYCSGKNLNSANIDYYHSLIKEFIKKKPNLAKKDINQYKSIAELQQALEETDLSDRQKERQLRNNMKGARQVFKDDKWTVWVPDTYEASCTLGAGSGWCTADTRTRSYYDDYLEEHGGEYYIIVNNQNPQEKYQFHFESHQFMGSGTNPGHTLNSEYSISLGDFYKKNPDLAEFFKSKLVGDLREQCKIDSNDEHKVYWDTVCYYFGEFSGRDSLSKSFLEKCFSGDVYEEFLDVGSYFDANAVAYEISGSNIERLKEVIIKYSDDWDKETLDELRDEEIINIAYENTPIDDGLRRAYDDAECYGAERECMNDFYNALDEAIRTVGEGKYTYGETVIKVDFIKLQNNLSSLQNDTSDNFEDGIEKCLADYLVDNFREPYYGWQGFDNEIFNEILSEEIGDLLGE